MATAIEYALMAGHAYRTTRDEINWIPGPQGWTPFFPVPDPTTASAFPVTAGFEAVSFVNGTEIVISFAGTGPGSIFSADWVHGNIPLALGNLSDQLRQAADYYLQVKAQNPGATISFTGHSLGGGLASLMAIFFGESAFTFDQAPFRSSALTYSTTNPDTGIVTTHSVAQDLLAYLSGETTNGQSIYTAGQLRGLTDFINTSVAESGVIPNESNVTDINVQGEILSSWLVPFSRIGTQANIPDSASGVSGTDLHSQALLTAFLQSNQTAAAYKTLSDVTVKLPDLLKMIFDPQLFYRDPNKLNNPERNLLEHLVRHEAGVQGTIAADAMVTRFTSDLWKIAQDGGMTMRESVFANGNNVSKALTAFAMQKYYEESNPNVCYGELFTDLTTAGTGSNGIQFDMTQVSKDFATTLAQSGKGGDLTQVKGYQYFQEYLYLSGLLSPEERTLIQSLLPYMRDWYVQAGANGMNASDTLNRGAFMLGGNGADTLTGGTANDLLVGNTGDDTLKGGQGNDTLLGGSGNDTYVYQSANTATGYTGDGFDTILDSDGQGKIFMDSVQLTGGAQFGDTRVHRDTSGHLYVNAGSNLIIDSNMLVQNYTSGNLGLNMTGPAADTNPVTTRLIEGDYNPIDSDPTHQIQDGAVHAWTDDLGNLLNDTGYDNTRSDTLYDSAGNDRITSGGGIDYIRSFRGGDDIIDAGAGSDFVIESITAGGGNDVIMGGEGRDIMSGGTGNDRIYADTQIGAADAIATGNIANSGIAQAGDWLNGGTGDDTLIGSAGRDVLMGGDGTDLLVGGAGNDYISGDHNWTSSNFGWTVTVNPNSTCTIGFDSETGYDKSQPTTGAADVIYAGEGNDFAVGGAGNDVIFGERGDDILWGEAGNDILMGGAGADYLNGGAGRDIYIFNRGDGKDTVYDTKADNNIFRFGDGINSSDITLRLGSLMLDFGNGDEIHIDNFDRNDVFNSSSISSFEFADGTTLSTAELLARGFDLGGTTGNDTILGTNTTDRIDGGAGNDTLQGGGGSDVYLFGRGSGQDTIVNYDATATADKVDAVQFAADVLSTDVTAKRTDENSLTLSINGTTDTLTIADYFYLDGNSPLSRLEEIRFSDAVWTVDDVKSMTSQATSGNDVLYGFSTNDVMSGGDGNDSIDGLTGNDTLNGEAGNDVIGGGEGNDVLNGGVGNDILNGNIGNDILDGGAGRDVLSGGEGDDVYLFGRGSGQDTINDAGGNLDAVQFAGNVLPSDVLVGREGDDLVLRISGTTDELRVTNYFYNNTSSEYLVEEFRFADGSYATDRIRRRILAENINSGKASNDEAAHAWRVAA